MLTKSVIFFFLFGGWRFCIQIYEKEPYLYAYEGVPFWFGSGGKKPVYVITLTFCHLLIDSAVTRQTGNHGNKQRAAKTMISGESCHTRRPGRALTVGHRHGGGERDKFGWNINDCCDFRVNNWTFRVKKCSVYWRTISESRKIFFTTITVQISINY